MAYESLLREEVAKQSPSNEFANAIYNEFVNSTLLKDELIDAFLIAQGKIYNHFCDEVEKQIEQFHSKKEQAENLRKSFERIKPQ